MASTDDVNPSSAGSVDYSDNAKCIREEQRSGTGAAKTAIMMRELSLWWNRSKPEGVVLTKSVAEGGTSWVFEAEKRYAGFGSMPCIVKVLKRLDEMQPRAKEYAEHHDILAKETEALSIAHHSEYVLMLLGKGVFDGRAYLIMERFGSFEEVSRGQHTCTLEQWITYRANTPDDDSEADVFEREHPLGGSLAVERVLSDILVGVVDIKQYVLNHRDLKPSNILLGGRKRKIRFLDFQTAVCESESDYIGMSYGSTVYSSPEERRNGARDADALGGPREHISERADAYAFGLIMARCVKPTLSIDLLPTLTDVVDRRLFDKKREAIIESVPQKYRDDVSHLITYDASSRTSLTTLLERAIADHSKKSFTSGWLRIYSKYGPE